MSNYDYLWEYAKFGAVQGGAISLLMLVLLFTLFSVLVSFANTGAAFAVAPLSVAGSGAALSVVEEAAPADAIMTSGLDGSVLFLTVLMGVVLTALYWVATGFILHNMGTKGFWMTVLVYSGVAFAVSLLMGNITDLSLWAIPGILLGIGINYVVIKATLGIYGFLGWRAPIAA